MEVNRLLRILLVEDSDNDAQLLLREIRRFGYEAEYERVETAEDVRFALSNKMWDLVICDYSLPHLNAPTALGILKSSNLDLPFIIVSGTIGEETAVSALKAGAHDFLIKGKYARLGPAIERELREAESRRERSRAEAALREKEHLLSEAQRIGHIGSWSFDIVNDTLQYSDEMYRLLDISPREFQHTSQGFLNLMYSADRPIAAKWMDDIKAGRKMKELDFRIFHSSGELRYIQCRGAVVFDDSGMPKRFVGTAQDISERKLSEIQIRQQIAHLTALRTIDQAIMSSVDMRFTLDIVLSQVITQLQVDATSILLLDSTGQTMKYLATRGFRTETLKNARIGINDSYAGRVVIDRRLIRIENLKTQPDHDSIKTLLSGEDFVSYYGIPLITKGKVKGVLEIFQRVPLQPYPEWIDFLETLAGQAAIAIDNATLFENLQKSNFELEQAYDATIEGWSHALDLRDRETEGHTLRVTEMALKLARIMRMKEDKLIHMRRGGLLHDIGKLGVPDSILLKPDALTDEEWKIMRLHPQFAYDWLAPIPYLREAVEIPYCHHEKWDGSGYPRGLTGESIPLTSRIFAIADVWDALTSDRPYRQAWSNKKAVEYIRENSGSHFDPKVVEVFLSNIANLTSK
jgi:HD-GYP domain-containing protein (c-di-GMP phosphodiesterase class II)/DNA-binding response OmpR family regulator